MKPNTKTWSIFAICVIAVLGALSWLSWNSLRLERMEIESRREGDYQESLRLALWRIDSALTGIITAESIRSPESYHSGPESPFVCNSEFCKLHFDYSIAHQATTEPEWTVTHQPHDRDLSDLTKILKAWNFLMVSQLNDSTQLPPKEQWELFCNSIEHPKTPATSLPLSVQKQEGEQQVKSQKEYAARWQNYDNAQILSAPTKSGTKIGKVIPLWIGVDSSVSHHKDEGRGNITVTSKQGTHFSELFLARITTEPSRTHYQGMWVDWKKLERSLMQGISELFPNALLRPISNREVEPQDRLLASIPAVLDPGLLAPALIPVFSTQRIFLGGAWILVLLAIGVVGFVLRTSIELSERRARFVSAVTHELRTPLTTFQLYSQMLADGMVKEEKDQREYLGTLKTESAKLSKIVENVLLYARVEGGKSAPIKEQISVASLLSQIRERLDRRAKEAGMELLIENHAPENCTLELDPQSVEQILFNLVDNSCKYAANATDRRLHLEISQQNQNVEFLYSDHGPGIPGIEAKKVFLPFERGVAQEAAATRGIGMGLTLSRSLARQLGGELTLINTSKQGAFFLLQLPLLKS